MPDRTKHPAGPRPRIRLSRSIVGREEADAVARVLLEDGYLGMGAEVGRFEEELSAFLGVPRDTVVTVSSGTAALHLAVEAVVGPGEEVLVQSLTFLSSFQAIAAAGATPVACEIHPETITIDLDDARRRLTYRTRAIMPVHYASNPAGLAEVREFAAEHGLRVIEDAAHAFGCYSSEGLVGATGDVVCFSFDGIKNITSGEGGLVVTGDQRVAQYVRDARLLGVHRDSEARLAGDRSWEFDVHHRGYRYHMSNLFAAVGRVQLRRFPTEFAPARRRLAARYREALKKVESIALLQTDLARVIPHNQPVLEKSGRRDELRGLLASHGVETGIHYKPCHLLTFFGGGGVSLPLTEQMGRELLSLPLHPGISEEDVERVCEIIRSGAY